MDWEDWEVLFVLPCAPCMGLSSNKDLDDAKQFAEAKLRASGPNEKISLPENTENRLEHYRRDKPRDSQAYGYAYDSLALVTFPGGCGGGGSGVSII